MVKVTYDPQDNKKRCAWCLKDAQYVDYHDTEWGIPSHDDHHLFEHLILETFQAGLSWHTILKKREAFRLAFDNFSANKMASYHENEIEILVHNAAIIRHRGKIEAAIHNAKQFLRLQKQKLYLFLVQPILLIRLAQDHCQMKDLKFRLF